MDIYEVQLERGKCLLLLVVQQVWSHGRAAPTRKQQELCLLQAQNRPNHLVINPPGRRDEELPLGSQPVSL
jgi:hypothetical protein